MIILHGVWDLETAWLVSDSSYQMLASLEQITFTNRTLILTGILLLFLTPLFLWKIYPLLKR